MSCEAAAALPSIFSYPAGLAPGGGVSGMLQASGLNSRQLWQGSPRQHTCRSPHGDAPFLLALRFVAHLPYFKAASMLTLPQGLSTAGVVVTTLAYALTCLVASRWMAGLRRTAAEPPHPAALPLLGATAVLIAMLVMGSAIAMLLPRHPELAAGMADVLPACLTLLAPVCALFFAAQFLSVRILRAA